MAANKGSQPHLDLDHLITDLTPKKIVLRIRGDRSKIGSAFVTDPATGTLVVRPELRSEISRAMMGEMRRFRYRLYLLQAKLKLEAFWLKGICAAKDVVGDLYRRLR